MEIHKEGIAFLNLINNRYKLKVFLINKLPLAFLAGVNLESANADKAIASIKFKWINQNPFRSIYFAALSMAAELSTGVLAMMHLYGRKPALSMLVVANTAEFYKKATGKINFTCNEGIKLKKAIENSIQSLEPQSITVSSIGIDEKGDEVAKFTFTWSFKAKV
ncbi:MAG: DUF4442 domain-containing protein [Bacteroidia bacterium]